MNTKIFNTEAVRQICAGFFSIISGLDNIGKDMSDSHGKGKRRIYLPNLRHALLATNAAKTVSDFLVMSWTKQD